MDPDELARIVATLETAIAEARVMAKSEMIGGEPGRVGVGEVEWVDWLTCTEPVPTPEAPADAGRLPLVSCLRNK
jgi:hypothetical protein